MLLGGHLACKSTDWRNNREKFCLGNLAQPGSTRYHMSTFLKPRRYLIGRHSSRKRMKQSKKRKKSRFWI